MLIKHDYDVVTVSILFFTGHSWTDPKMGEPELHFLLIYISIFTVISILSSHKISILRIFKRPPLPAYFTN